MAWEKKANIRGPIGGAFPDAPSDGTIYARKDEGWVPAVDSFPEAPVDGEAYARKDGAWSTVDVDADTVGQLPVARVPDAQPLATVLTNTTASFTTALKAKLDGVATGATANSTDAVLLARSNHTGTQLAATISDFAAAADARISAAIGVTVQAFSAVLAATTAAFTTAKDTKLSGIATGATANQTDAFLLSRANHTGTQAISTISGLDAALAGKQPITPAREVLQASRTYYVRTDGSDANNGLANTPGGAFLTIQKAIDAAASLDLSVYSVTVQVANGTYTGSVVFKNYLGNGPIVIQGNTTTPANVLISTTGVAFSGTGVPGVYKLAGMKIVVSGGHAVDVMSCNVQFESLDFGACSIMHLRARGYAQIKAVGSYTISGGAQMHIDAGDKATIDISGPSPAVTVTLTGTPAFSAQFAGASFDAIAKTQSVTFSGSATGKRYSATQAALIYTGGGGASYLPGSVAGTVADGGRYL